MPSVLTIVTNQIITLLTGDGTTFFAQQVLPANRFSKLSGVKWPLPPNMSSRNIPSIIIDCPDRRVISRNQMKTFTNTTSATGDVVVQKEHTFLLTFVYEGMDRTIPNGMEEFIDGILLPDPTLGLTTPKIMVSGQISGSVKDEKSDDTGGTLRCIQRIRFPVTIEYHRADLIAAAEYAG